MFKFKLPESDPVVFCHIPLILLNPPNTMSIRDVTLTNENGTLGHISFTLEKNAAPVRCIQNILQSVYTSEET